MAQKIVNVCDFCLADEIETASLVHRSIVLNRIEYYVDLCKEHNETWYEPFAERVVEIGIRDSNRAAADFPFECEFCGRGFNHGSSKVEHVRQKHPETMKHCPECNHPVKGSHGLTMHQTLVHGRKKGGDGS